MKKIILILLTLSLLIISGCGNPVYSDETNGQSDDVTGDVVKDIENPKKEETIQGTNIKTLGDAFYVIAENWDADSQVDGLECSLTPKDENDRTIKTKGVIEASLYNPVCTDNSYGICMEESCLNKESDLIESWNLNLKEENFGILGATIRLEYNEYKITDDDYKKGCLSIKFTTLDGKEFFLEEDSVYLNGF